MKKKSLLLAIIMTFSLCVINQFVNAQIKPFGKKYTKCDCSLPNYGCKSYPCFIDCDRVCTIIMKPTGILLPVSKTEKVNAQIFDATGRLVKAFSEKEMRVNNNEISWDKKDENGTAVSPGIYLVKLDSRNYSETKKISVIK